jgi:hypothetical protein
MRRQFDLLLVSSWLVVIGACLLFWVGVVTVVEWLA